MCYFNRFIYLDVNLLIGVGCVYSQSRGRGPRHFFFSPLRVSSPLNKTLAVPLSKGCDHVKQMYIPILQSSGNTVLENWSFVYRKIKPLWFNRIRWTFLETISVTKLVVFIMSSILFAVCPSVIILLHGLTWRGFFIISQLSISPYSIVYAWIPLSIATVFLLKLLVKVAKDYQIS